MLHDVLEVIKKDIAAKAAILFFVFFTAWWLYLLSIHSQNSVQNTVWGSVYPLVSLWGGIWGLIAAKKWGGMSSVMGKVCIAFSMGLLFQFLGQVYYTGYFLITQGDVPYPSIGDIGYFGSIPWYILGVYFMGKAAGIKFAYKSATALLWSIVIPVIMLTISYFLFLKNYTPDWTNPAGVYLDFAYPLGQAIYVSFAILAYLLSRRTLGGIMRSRILLILLALCIQYLADYTFLYLFRNGSYYAAGITDYIYLLSYTLMTVAILNMKTIVTQIKESV